MLSKRSTGLYHKFTVTRTDGTDKPGQKHDGCEYFVLDADHDPHAVAALRAYAESCEAAYPVLAADVRRLADRFNASPPHPETEQRIDNGNSFVFCDAVQTTKGQSLCCVRGAGHSGPHAFVLPPIPLSPVILAYLNTGSAHPETEGP